jgi:hypothetical protein
MMSVFLVRAPLIKAHMENTYIFPKPPTSLPQIPGLPVEDITFSVTAAHLTMISGFHCNVDKIYALLGYYAALCDNPLPHNVA